MKTRSSTSTSQSDSNATHVSRRTFLASGGAAAAAAGVGLLPASALGSPGSPGANGRLNLAFIGVGSQGLRVMFNFLKQPDVRAVAVCDPNKSSADYPQWGNNEFCEAVRGLLGTHSGWEWLSPNVPIQLTSTLRVTSGVAGREPARQIIDAYYAKDTKSGATGGGCRAYSDYRELLEKERDLDGVVIGTTDHWHALIACAAMRAGKHVFCQKPMSHSIHEARQMGRIAAETKVATQVAVGPQASEETRRICEWVWSGAIGKVHTVINWSNRPVWPQGLERPKETHPIPEGLDWDLWLGPAPLRPFNRAYLPFVWRGWHDFGCGALGDMGCYSLDVIFRVMRLGAPTSVEASSSPRFEESFPSASSIEFKFPARGDLPPLTLHWYDGGLRPPHPEGFDGKLPEEGILFVGEKGTILTRFTGESPKIIPQGLAASVQEPPKTLPRSPGNEREWLNAAKGGAEKPGANFEFSARVTEALLLGNVALARSEKLLWDSPTLRVTNIQGLDPLIKPAYRGGWVL